MKDIHYLPTPRRDWAFDRTAIRRDMACAERLMRQKLNRREELYKLCVGVAIVVAHTGQIVKLSREPTRSTIERGTVCTLLD